MRYFHKLKNDCMLSLSCLLKDIATIACRANLPKYEKSVDFLKRYVENALFDISMLSDNILLDWQLLVYATFQEARYEKHLSNLMCRFGSIAPSCGKAYSALDKLCDEITSNSGIEDIQNYPTVVICGGDPYTTITGMNQICLKVTDIQRPWNWGIIAHELGHDITRMFYSTIALASRKSRRVRLTRKPNSREILRNWRSEILCDIFGTLIAGPSLLDSHMMIPRIWALMPLEEASIFDFFSIHPPDEMRYRIMRKILEENGLSGIIDTEEVVGLQDIVSLDGIDESEKEQFHKRLKFVEKFTPAFLEWSLEKMSDLQNRVGRTFSLENWHRSCIIGEYLLGEADRLPNNPTAIEVVNGLTSVRKAIKTIEKEKDVTEKALELF